MGPGHKEAKWKAQALGSRIDEGFKGCKVIKNRTAQHVWDLCISHSASRKHWLPVIVIWNLPWLSADSCSEVEINPPPRNPENISLRISHDPWGILRWPPAPLAALPPLLRSYASASSAAHEVGSYLRPDFFYPRCWIVLDVQITSINIDNILYPTSSDKCSIVRQDRTTWYNLRALRRTEKSIAFEMPRLLD